jgi:hypothetical protein
MRTPRIYSKTVSRTEVQTYGSSHIKDEDAPEDPSYRLGDIPPWTLGLRSGTGERKLKHRPRISPASPLSTDAHSNELHALETEGGLYDDGRDSQEPVGSRVVN